MPTNGEVCRGLKKTEVGLSLPDTEGHRRMLYLSDCGSIVSFKKLPENEKIKEEMERRSVKLTPNNIGQYLSVDLSVDDSVFTNPAKQDLPFKSDYMFVALNIAERKEGQAVNNEWGQFHDMVVKTPTYNFALMTNHERFRGSYITDILKNTVDSSSANIDADYFVSQESKNPGIFLDQSDENIKKLAIKAYPGYLKRYKENLVKNNDRNTITIKDSQVINVYVRDLTKPNADQFFDSAQAYEKVIRHNQEKYRQSAMLFIKECQIVQPKHLIVLGDKAQNVIRNMRRDGLFGSIPEVEKLVDNLIESQHYSKQGKESSTMSFMNYLQTLLKKTDAVKR